MLHSPTVRSAGSAGSAGSADSATPRVAFLVEQCMGHVTHGLNLESFLATQDAVAPVWLPIGYEMGAIESRLPVWRTQDSLRGSWRARLALQAAGRREPLQAAFLHTQSIAFLAADLMGRLPSVVSLDATPINLATMSDAYGRRGAGDGWVDRQKYLLARRTFHAAAALVSWSEWGKRSLVEDYGVPASRVHVLPPGTGPTFFEIGRRRQASPETPESPADEDRPLRILFVGGDFERKGGDLLLECLRGPGGGRYELHIVTRDAARVPAAGLPNVRIYEGVRPNSPELLGLFATADVFALPTRADCMAFVTMEAAAAGLPVITADIGAMSETVVEGESGFVVPPGDAGALSAVLARLSDDPGLRRRMGRAAHALAAERFDAGRNFGTLMQLLTSVALPGPRRSPRVIARPVPGV